MFARLDTNLPQEPKYPRTLSSLGYELVEGEGGQTQIKKVSDNTYFPYYNSDNERDNQLHREAMHYAVREIVAQQAAQHDVVEVFLGGEKGDEISGDAGAKPKRKHFKVMATKMEDLKKKRNVVVVVGSSAEDLGIWSWKETMGEGGLDSGSVVGLAKQLQKMSFGAANPIYRSNHSGANDAGLSNGDKEEPLATMDPYLEDVPGVILFNPGQIFYSHSENSCMTMTSWMARRRDSVIGAPYKIMDDENRVPGHMSSKEHVATMFDSVLPQLIHPNARLFVVGIGDGAEQTIMYMDEKMRDNPSAKIGGLVSALAFMEPTHLPHQIHSIALRQHLASFAKSWINSSKPKDTWINSANGMDPLPVHHGPEVVTEDKVEAGHKHEGVEDGDGDGDGDDSIMADSYDYSNGVVSCHTYSGATDMNEMIWVNIRDSALDFFKWIADKEDGVKTGAY